MKVYVVPAFRLKAFNCPFCNAYSTFAWSRTSSNIMTDAGRFTAIEIAQCTHCYGDTYWEVTEYESNDEPKCARIVIPKSSPAPLPNEDMPDESKKDYMEARSILSDSPRGAAALLRLAVQRICSGLVEKSDGINNDIIELVEKGLPVYIKEALDIVRVIGNNAVHPGKLSDGDIAELVVPMFHLVNDIVDDRISRPKAHLKTYNMLPETTRKAIAERDAKALSGG